LQQRPALNIEKIQNNPQVCTQKKKAIFWQTGAAGQKNQKETREMQHYRD
jgi:hypothetical protein